MAEPRELSSTLKKLSLHPVSSSKKSKTPAPLADSWDDEELELSDSELPSSLTTSASHSLSPKSQPESLTYPSAPPPTPISPDTFPRSSNTSAFDNPYGYSAAADSITTDSRSSTSGRRAADTRPEKTDAVAKRLIAGALGVRAPKKTDEQRAYERAVKEKEIKRRNGEREAAVKAKEEAERAKAAVWED